MAMSLDTAIKFTAKLEGQGLDQLKRGLQGLAQQSNRTSKDLDQLYNANKKLAQASGQSLNSLQRQITVMSGLRNEAAIGSRQFKFYSAELDKLNKQQARLTGASKGGGGLLAIGGSLGGLAAAAGGALAVKFVADVGLQAESAQVRLQALAGEFGEYNQAQEAAARIAEKLRISNTEATQSFASLYASLRPTGITIQELEKAFVGFSAAARNSGATAQETSNALIQLKQGLASGTLQGEELRSIREQAPLAAQAIARELGVTIGELKDLAAEGKVTTDVVLSALGKLQDQQLGKLNAQFQTGAQALTDLQNELRRTGEGIAKAFGPTAIALLRAFTRGLQRVADGLGLVEGAAERRADRIRADLQAQRESREKFGVGGVFRYGFQIDRFQNERSEQLFNQFQAERRQRALGIDNPNADQREAREDAAAERQAARDREASEKRQALLEKELKVRSDAEDKLADAAQRNAEQIAEFRERTLERAAKFEQSIGAQRLQIERDIADAQRRTEDLRASFAVETERQRLKAAGLSTDSLDLAERVNERFRKFYQERINNERSAADKLVEIQRELEEFKIETADGIGKIQEGYARSVRNILLDAGKKLGELMEAGARNAAGALTSGGGSMSLDAASGIIARTGNTGESTGAHLDARWADGRRISAADVDRFLRVNGRAPSSFGVTSPYGPRNLFGRNFHSGIDFGTPAGSGITLQNGAKVLRDLGFTGAGGYAVEIDTPQGRMRLLHLQGGSVARAAAPPPPLALPSATGAGPAGFDPSGVINRLQGSSAALAGDVRLQQATKDAEAFAGLMDGLNKDLGEVSGKFDDIGTAIVRNRENVEATTELIRSGMSPELADQVLQIQRGSLAAEEGLRVLESQIKLNLENKTLTAAQRADLEKMLASVRARLEAQPQLTQQAVEEAAAFERAQVAQKKLEEQRQRLVELTQSIGGSLSQGIIGGIDAAINAAMTGAEGLEDQLKQIASGVLKDIGMALIRFGLNSLLGGAFGGGFFKFADGGVMTNTGAMPLKRYAGGGVANSPQMAIFGERGPEAYVPLPDGRNIPVKMQQRSDALNRYKPMGATGTMAADGNGGATGGGSAAATGPIDVRYTVERINNVEYVTAEQFQQGMQQAAAQGASRGEQRALRSLQQSTAVRSRVGMR